MPIRPRYVDLFEALKDPDPIRSDKAFDDILFERGNALPDLIASEGLDVILLTVTEKGDRTYHNVDVNSFEVIKQKAAGAAAPADAGGMDDDIPF